MCQISHTPLENLFLNVRVAAHCAGRKIEQLCEETQHARIVKRQRTIRSKQAAIFAEEEARLHEQVMIEQVILLERLQREQEASRMQAEEQIEIAAFNAPSSDTSSNKEEPTGARIVLVPSSKQERKVEAIEQKLALMRRRIAPSKNAAGIATLQAAVASF
jgi:hypothetical protein